MLLATNDSFLYISSHSNDYQEQMKGLRDNLHRNN